MGLKPKFTSADISKMMEQKRGFIKDAILSRLSFVGEEFVKMAREKTRDQGGFGDVTGNLRSSIGYVVLNNGEVAKQGFEIAAGGINGYEMAKQHTKALAMESQTGYALIVVAGMDYAAHVEHKGRDVITGSSLTAEALLKDALKKIEEGIK